MSEYSAPHLWLYCQDFAHLGVSCCSSCHTDADEYDCDLCEIEPDENGHGRGRILASVCCAFASDNRPSRSDFVRGFFEQRRRYKRREGLRRLTQLSQEYGLYD